MAVRLTVEAFLATPGAVVDVRSPGEFRQGHIPGSINLPLLDDLERAEVGTAYKQQGRAPALQRGLELVGPKLAELGAALVEAHRGADAGSLRLMCWRGGQRSASVAWLAETLDLPAVLLEGGYKGFRLWVLDQVERPWPLRLLGGRTGTGKTDLLLCLRERGVAVVDLEGLAHHRGSSFGGLGMPPQPSTEHFENRIACTLHGLRQAGEIWLEAESAQVGHCRIPAGLWRQMETTTVLEVQRPLAARLRQLVAIYGVQDADALAAATQRIARRLGPQRTAAALEAIAAADWTSACSQMLDYYDRCYDHDLQRHHLGTGDAESQQRPVDLGELSAADAADRLLEQGLVQPGVGRAGVSA